MDKTFVVSYSKGRERGQYAICIAINNVHASLDTWYYDHQSGNHVSIGLYSMTPSEIYQLAHHLMGKAYEIYTKGEK